MRRSIACAAVVTVGLSLTGCSGSEDAGPAASKLAVDGTFRMAMAADTDSWNPYASRAVLGLSRLMYDSLLNQTSSGELVSGLASEWSATPDSATFTLRDGVTCSDGTELTASHVAEVINFNSDPENASPQYGLYTSTRETKATGDDSGGVVTVTLAEPDGLLLNEVGLLPVVCPNGFENPDLLANESDGTGPYVLDEATSGVGYTFVVREGYAWGPDGASTDEPGMPAVVELRVVPNTTTAANLLLAGDLTLANISGPDQQRLDGAGLEHVPWNAAGAWLTFNHAEGRVGADPDVRRALVQALDIDEVLRVSTGDTGTAPTTLEALGPQVCPSDDPIADELPPFDPAAAMALLDDAGWVEGDDGVRAKDGDRLTIDLHYQTDGDALEKPTSELIAQRWSDIGADVTISGNEIGAVVEVLYETSNFDVMMIGYNFALPSQIAPYLSGATPPAGSNVGFVENADYDKAVAQALQRTLPEACGDWEQARAAIVRDVDIAPLSNRTEKWFLNGGQAEMQAYGVPIPTSLRVLR